MNNFYFIGYNLSLDQITDLSLVSGEVKNSNYLMRSLVEVIKNYRVVPISIDLYEDNTKKIDSIQRIRKSSAKGILRWYFEAMELRKLLSKVKSGDVVYATIPSYLPFLKVPKGVKVIITAHGTYWPELIADLEYEKSLVKKVLHICNGVAQLMIDKIAFKRAAFLHSVSDFQIEEMINSYSVPSEKIVSIRNGTNFKKLQCEKKYDILWVGRLAKKKNIAMLNNIKNQMPDLKYSIVTGNDYFAIDEGSISHARNIIHDSSTNTQCYSDVSESVLNKIMAESKVLVVTSTGYESIPTVIFEALASGCFVVAPNSWGVNEVEGDGIFTYKEGDVSDAIDKINAALVSRSCPMVFDCVRWGTRAEEFQRKFL